MEFVAILGDRGAFKTCFMTSLLAADARNKRRPIFANYTLYFPARYVVRKLPFGTIAAMARETSELHGSSIGLDELGVGADSYDFFENQPKEIVEMVAQLRKDRAIAYYTVQRFDDIARRLRKQTDAYFLCEDVDRNLNPGPDHRDTCMGISHIHQMDADLRYVRDFYFDGKPWYRWYNTDEKQVKGY